MAHNNRMKMKNKKILKIYVRLIILLLIISSGCSGSKTTPDRSKGEEPLNEQKKLIEKNISNEIKKAEMLKLVDEFQLDLESFYIYYTKHRERMTTLHRSYDTTSEQFEQARNEFIPKYKQFLSTVISKRMKLRDLSTQDEWKAISKITKTYIPPKDYREN